VFTPFNDKLSFFLPRGITTFHDSLDKRKWNTRLPAHHASGQTQTDGWFGIRLDTSKTLEPGHGRMFTVYYYYGLPRDLPTQPQPPPAPRG
jgi:hypothetical protein